MDTPRLGDRLEVDFRETHAVGPLASALRWPGTEPEWAEAPRTGGRFVLDLPSFCGSRPAAADGGEAAGSDGGGEGPLATAAGLAAVADERGLAVVDIVPWGVLLPGGAVDLLLLPGGTRWWRRLLSWTEADDRLSDCAFFLEREFLGRLGGVLPGRHLAVFEDRADPTGNAAWLESRDALLAAVAEGIVLDRLSGRLGISPADFRSALGAHLRAGAMDLRLFDGLCQALARHGYPLDVASFLEEDVLTRFDAWSRERRRDREVMEQARGWFDAPGVDDRLQIRGVRLGAALEYSVIEKLQAGGPGLRAGGAL